ncbi:MAG: hypothetical protein GWM98_19870, partial [Nitrospinaceae bacterium]|nr:hypothetical protein [Nitrospinaceae bacterium]NIS86785.1 hypothetical protein [Nitrospinaceae bacterium]NIT83619.1 hypothetical protein [Nitrospinaceae bacterium]NIU45822.1 hypothetical protein [Nitrospinaceae bacterium]NIU97978.1 hypothetical protein [Nitrospinaceae bacterium]
MDVKILKQEYGKAFLSWKAQVKSECRGTVSLFVKLQFLDGRGRELEDSLVPVSNLGSSES